LKITFLYQCLNGPIVIILFRKVKKRSVN